MVPGSTHTASRPSWVTARFTSSWAAGIEGEVSNQVEDQVHAAAGFRDLPRIENLTRYELQPGKILKACSRASPQKEDSDVGGRDPLGLHQGSDQHTPEVPRAAEHQYLPSGQCDHTQRPAGSVAKSAVVRHGTARAAQCGVNCKFN